MEKPGFTGIRHSNSRFPLSLKLSKKSGDRVSQNSILPWIYILSNGLITTFTTDEKFLLLFLPKIGTDQPIRRLKPVSPKLVGTRKCLPASMASFNGYFFNGARYFGCIKFSTLRIRSNSSSESSFFSRTNSRMVLPVATASLPISSPISCPI